MEQTDLFKTVHEEPMEVDTALYYRDHSEDSSDRTGDSNEQSPTPSEDELAMKTENTDDNRATDDLSLDMSKLQLTPSRLQILPPINAQVIVTANQSRLETIKELNENHENHTSEGRLSEDDEAIQSEQEEEANIEAEAKTAVEVENETMAEVEKEAETMTEVEKEAETIEANVEKEAETEGKVEKEAETEGKEKKKKKKRKTELQSLIDAANNIKF